MLLIVDYHLFSLNSRSVLVGASYQTTDGILAAYEKLISKNKDVSSKPLISQNRSLQLLFDLRFIMAVVARKEDTPVILFI